jgi:hypothetical protein
MNQLSNLNATLVKTVRYETNTAISNTLNFTVENCSVVTNIQKIVFYLDTPDQNFASQTQITISDRGHTFPGKINGFIPTVFASIGTNFSAVFGGTNTNSVLIQNSPQVVTAIVNQSTLDSEGIGNIYVKLQRTTGNYTGGFTMAVFYQPGITYNSNFNTRNQISNDAPFRVLSQFGIGTYANGISTMVDQTQNVAWTPNRRNNIDNLDFGFGVSSSSPFFYFGTPYKTTRWFLGFSSDNTPNIGVVTFNYFNGTNFTSFSTTYVGANGPGTYKFANDGVIIFSPPSDWQSLKMDNDPLTKYNQVLIGLGSLATNAIANNPQMYWVQCQIGFSSAAPANQTITVSSVSPLIEPNLPLTFPGRKIPS